LDGIDDHVSLPSGTIPDSNLTIAMWINPQSLPPTAGLVLAFWGVQSGCFPSSQEFAMFKDHLEMFTGCAEALRLDGAAPITAGAWQHVVLTVDPVGNDALYFNGAQVATGNSRGGTPVSVGNDLIGAAWVGGVIIPEVRFGGAIDEVQIYNRVLSPAEVSELYDAGKGRFGAVEGGGLVAGYHFDEGNGASAADFSGNGKTASLINGVGWTASPVALEALPFASFSAHVGLRLGPAATDDSFALRAAFSLGNDSDGINPSGEDVRLKIGTFSTTIPAGSFKTRANVRFEFVGVIEGVTLKAVLISPPRSSKTLVFVTGRGADLTGTVLPVSVSLTIGDDQGNTTLTRADVVARSEP
jgi:hypothetical protein